jgi:integrase
MPPCFHAGESVKVVQARLGHASAAETLNTYAHLWPDSEDRTRAAIESALGTSRSVETLAR